MSISRSIGLLLGLAMCGPALATDFGVMESAEAIEPKAFKVSAFPLLTERTTRDNEGGLGATLGYGLPYGLDVEGLVARYDNGTQYGTDIEWNAFTMGNVLLSIAGGLHTVDFDEGGGVNGADTTAIVTWTPVHRLDLNLALDASYEDVNVGGIRNNRDRRYNASNEFETYYIAPGVEYALTRDIDVLAEVGLGLNGTSDDYAGLGVAWYLAR
jgi:hypothetical protein